MKKLLSLLLLFTACSTPCKGIIGAKYHPDTHTVEYIFPDSPAEKANIELGDILLTIPSGNENDIASFEVLKSDGSMKLYEIKLVCYYDVKKPRNWN